MEKLINFGFNKFLIKFFEENLFIKTVISRIYSIEMFVRIFISFKSLQHKSITTTTIIKFFL